MSAAGPAGDRPVGPADPADLARRELLASVASLYYLEGMDQKVVAATVGLSRSTVSRMIAQAREVGVVRIEVDRPLPRHPGLERAVERRFGRRALVVAAPAAGVVTPALERVGRWAPTTCASAWRRAPRWRSPGARRWPRWPRSWTARRWAPTSCR